MSQPNPFSRANAQEHNLVSKIINPPLLGAPFQAVVDLVDIHTAYALQIGSETEPVQLEYVNQIGDPDYPSQQLYVKQIGIAEVPTEQIYVDNIGDTGASGSGYFNELVVGTLYCTDIRPPPSGGTGGKNVVGGTGIQVDETSTAYTVSSLISGGTGIGVNIVGNGYQISNTQRFIQGPGINIAKGLTGDIYTVSSTCVQTVTSTPTSGIAVDNSDPLNPKISTYALTGVNAGPGIFVSSGSSPQVPLISATGVYRVQAGSGISITGDPQNPVITSTGGGGTGINPVGPTGQIPYFTASGLTSVASVNYDGTQVNVPALNISTNPTTASLYLEASGITSTIYSGMPNSGNILNIGDLRGYASGRSNTSPPTMTIDTLIGTVGIGNSGPTYSLDVNGNARIVYDGTTSLTDVTGGSGATGSCRLSAGSTYTIFGWGGGGAGNGGAGGAGGYSEVTFNTGVTGATFYWDQRYGGARGGGDALVCWIDGGATFLYVPGGGAGITGGTGAAAGEPQALPIREGGVSSTAVGVDAVASCTLNNPWKYSIGATIVLNPDYSFSGGEVGITGGTFSSGGNIYGTVSTIPAGTTGTVRFSQPAVLQTVDINTGTTYYLADDSTTLINIQGTFVFSGVTFQSNSGTLSIPDNTPIQIVNTLNGTTGSGSAIFNNWPDNDDTPEFVGVSVNLANGLPVDSGQVTLVTPPEGITFTSDQIGLNWFFASSNLTETEDNRVVTIGEGSTLIFPGFLTGITASTISTTGQVVLPTGTELSVASRQFTSYGASATGSHAINYGGGGYTGGGEPALVLGVISVRRVPLPLGGFVTFPDFIDPIGPPSNRLAGGGAGSWYIAPGLSGVTYGGVGIYSYTNEYGGYGDGSTGSSKTPGFLIIKQVNTLATPNPALFVDGYLTVTGGATFGKTVYGTTGQFSGNVIANDLVATSDIRTKENIITIDSALSKVLGMHGVYFTRKNEEGRKVGVIAQEVEEILPEVVYTGEDGMKSVSYGSIVGLLIEAIKEQNEQIKKLQM